MTAGAALVIAFMTVTSVQSSRLRVQAVQLQEQAAKLTSERDKASEVTQFLTEIISSADPYQESGHVPTLHEVLDRGAKLAETSLKDRPEVRAHLLSSIAPAYFGLGDWDRAGAIAEEAVNIRRATLAPNNAELAASLLYLSGVRMNQGRAAEAEPIVREAIAIYNGRTDISHAERVSASGTLGMVLLRQSRLDEADQVIRPLLLDERLRQPLDTARVAQLSRNLAHILRDKRSYAEALPLYQTAYDLHVLVYGREHPESANSAVNLGNAYAKRGNAVVAESLLRAGVATKRRLLGIEHHDVAADQITLANALAQFGKRKEADALRAEAEAARARGGKRK